MLAAGGGIACINSIHREKDQNTFDYQRVTRLTPLELTLGKLFGAPVFTYFVFLCLMPLAIFGVVAGKQKPFTVLTAYVVLLIGSLTIHMLALLISLLTVKGSHTGAILLLLVLLWSTSFSAAPIQFFKIGPLGPFYATQIANRAGWEGTLPDERLRNQQPGVSADIDAVFGNAVDHIPVLITLDLMFAAWFLLALVEEHQARSELLRDLFSSAGARLRAVFESAVCGVHAVARGDAGGFPGLFADSEHWRFLCLGLAAIRNRERMRRILRSGEGAATTWLAAMWPAP